MNDQISNLPAAVLVGISVCLAPGIDKAISDLNANLSQPVAVADLNAVNAGGSLMAPIEFALVEEANVVEMQINNSERSAYRKKFDELAAKWKTETGGLSSVASMVMHPAYLEIISHGEKMIPFILLDLQHKPSHWFIALKTLANCSPVKPEDAGNMKKMTEAWLAWGRENGFLP